MGFSFQRRDYFRLIGKASEPSVSLYSPMEASPPERRQNPTRFRNLLKTVEAGLKEYPQHTGRFLATLRELDTDDFWRQPRRGLALFLSQDLFEFHKLPFEVPELVVVSDTFHTRPLLKYVATESSYYVLSVSQDHVTLFEGWRDFVAAAEVPSLPRHMKDVVGEKEQDSQRHFHSAAAGGRRSVYHTSGKGYPDVQHELRAFFRAVDDEVCRLLQDCGRPIIIAAQAKNQAIYQEVSRLKSVTANITVEAKDLDPEELARRAWPLMERWARERFKAMLERFHKAKSSGRATDDLQDVARRAALGEVKLLMLAPGPPRWGHLDRFSGEIRLQDEPAGAADVVDDLAELVLQRGGEVRLWEGETFPVASGVAAVYKH